MPSGSHAGSPGSHSSGGASFGGGGFGGGSHSSHSGGGYYHGPHFGGFSVIFLGRSYHGQNSKSSIIASWITLVIVSLIVGLIFFASTKAFDSDVAKIKEDYAYYQTIINTAKKSPDTLIKEADVTDYFLGTGNKYYITYEYEYDTTRHLKLEGYTYSVYTRDEANALLAGGSGKVQIAINKAPVNSTTDSITMDFDGRDFKNDGDYIQAQTGKKAVTIVFSIIFAVIGVFVLLTIVGTVKTIKHLNDPTPEKKEDQKQDSTKPSVPTCAYCGSALKEGQTQCPSCGARVRKK